ncbi:hypothetical protein RRG08_035565 [Elysia crispata]|uniref:Uncharacterized protein n=1 Tax=Elysia crispata TaxID=231223 RepID=A0AAE1B3K4_9GAST|nr:hypothetical protein RRG08_035565 [Elysia crispata]
MSMVVLKKERKARLRDNDLKICLLGCSSKLVVNHDESGVRVNFVNERNKITPAVFTVLMIGTMVEKIFRGAGVDLVGEKYILKRSTQ